MPLKHALHFYIADETRRERMARNQEYADGTALESVVDFRAPVSSAVDAAIVPEF